MAPMTDVSPSFGFDNGASLPGGASFEVREAQNGVEHDVPFPSTVQAGDWLRFTLTMDFTANGGDGAGSFSYQDLTAGGADIAVAGLQNVNLKLSNLPASSMPSAWDSMYIRIDNGIGGVVGIDNLTTIVPEPATLSLAGLGLLVLIGRRRR